MIDDIPREKRQPTGDYPTGYCRPPKASQFQPGRSGNPNGRPKKYNPGGLDVSKIINQPVTVRIGNKTERMSGYEALIRTLYARALKGNVRAADQFLGECDAHNVVPIDEYLDGGGVLTIPEYLMEEYNNDRSSHAELSPRWRQYLNVEARLREKVEVRPKRLTRRERLTLSYDEALKLVALEKHCLIEGGLEVWRTSIELVFFAMRRAALSGNLSATKLLQKYLHKFGSMQAMPMAYLVIPPELTTEEWVKQHAPKASGASDD